MKHTIHKRSVTNKIIFVNFMMMLTMTVFVCIIIFVMLCRSYNAKLFQETDGFLEEQRAKIRNDVEMSIHKTDLIVKNVSISKRFNEKFTSLLSKTEFANDMKIYMDALEDMNLDNEHQMVIYYSNETLYESQYIRKIEALEKRDEILKKMENSQLNTIWLDEITWQEEVPYLYFYRRMPVDTETIIEGCIRLDIGTKNSEQLQVEFKKIPQAEGARQLSGHARIRSVYVFDDWYLISEISLKTLYSQYITYFLALVFFMCIVIVSVYFVSKKSVKDIIEAITELLENIRDNNIVERDWKPETNFWEFDVILKRTQSLIKQVDDLEKSYYKNELLRKKVEIELLNYKLNPHILYNSLSAVNLVAYKQDYGQVRNIIHIMIDYYRDVLGKDCEIITVDEELMLIEKFLNISRISRNQDYALETQITDEIRRMPIPHMLFQPIVENAIMHGFNNCDAETIISITGVLEGDYLIFSITDSGKGMTEEQTEKLNRLECSGYGVKNTARRIHFYYGETCGLFFSSAPGKGTTATIKIQPKIFGLSMYSDKEI